MQNNGGAFEAEHPSIPVPQMLAPQAWLSIQESLACATGDMSSILFGDTMVPNIE